MAINLCRTIGPLTLHSQEIVDAFLYGLRTLSQIGNPILHRLYTVKHPIDAKGAKHGFISI